MPGITPARGEFAMAAVAKSLFRAAEIAPAALGAERNPAGGGPFPGMSERVRVPARVGGTAPAPAKEACPMQIAEIMTRDVRLAAPEQTVKEAARMMAELDVGAIPVAENDRLVGMLTDRDICVRAVAAGKNPNRCKVGEVMSAEVKYVFEDETTADLARNMSTLQVRRMPVLDRDRRLVGIVSLGDLATANGAADETKDAIAGVSEKTA
jgi:CBS domain-containing protein